MTSLLTNRKFQPVLHWILLFLTIANCQFLAAVSMAAPIFASGGHQTDRRGANSIYYLPAGDYVQLYVFLESSDPIGSPTISVEASQGGTTVTLVPIPAGSPIFPPYGYFKFIDFDPDLTGSWLVTATDSTGVASALTPPIAEPEFLPLVEGVTLQGTPLGETVSWTVPDLMGFDVDGVNVRLITAGGSQLWQSDLLTPRTTSLTTPAGILEVGVDYVYMISLLDIDGGYVENLSSAFSTPFFYTIPGDLDKNGVVDGADFLFWQRGDSISPLSTSDLGDWEANFGTVPLNAGSTAVPEPAALVCGLISVLAGCGCRFTQRLVKYRGKKRASAFAR